jgi:hypothetical protein
MIFYSNEALGVCDSKEAMARSLLNNVVITFCQRGPTAPEAAPRMYKTAHVASYPPQITEQDMIFRVSNFAQTPSSECA